MYNCTSYVPQNVILYNINKEINKFLRLFVKYNNNNNKIYL